MFNAGDVVRMKAREGEIQAGATGLVIGVQRYPSGEVLVVRFERATRVVRATSVEAVSRDDLSVGTS